MVLRPSVSAAEWVASEWGGVGRRGLREEEDKEEGGSGTCNRVDNGIYGRHWRGGGGTKEEEFRLIFFGRSSLQDNVFGIHPLGQRQGCLWNEGILKVRTKGGADGEGSLV